MGLGEMPFDVALAAATALAVMGVLTALGALIGGGKERLPATDTVVGLGLAGGALTLLAVASQLPISLWAGLLGGAGIAALGWSASQRRLPGGPGLFFALLLAAPLLVFAAIGPATMSDDFAQWLRNAAYVYTNDSLPRPGLPPTPSHWPAYPHLLPFIVAGASWLAGRFLESAGPVANVVFLASTAAAIADTAMSDRNNLPARLAVTALAIAAFLGVFFPELNRNVLFSSYADTATIAAVAVLGLLGVALLERLGEDGETGGLAWRFGFAAAALINLKQANPVLLALLALGLLLAAWRGGNLRWNRALRLLPPMILPAALVFLVWRFYVKHNLPAGEKAFRPPALWNWDAVPAMIQALGDELARNPSFHLLMWAVTLAGLWKWRTPRRPEELLALLTAVVWIGYNAFLIVVYLGAMDDWEARIAADYWRYTPHVGMLGLAAGLLWLRRLPWPAPLLRQSRPLLLGLAALLPLGLLMVGPQRLSALGKEWPMQFRKVGGELAEILPRDSRLVATKVFDYYLTYSGIDFDLRRFGRDDRGLRYLDTNGKATLAMFQSGEATHLLVMDHFGSVDDVTGPLGIPPVVNESALFEWTGTDFRKIHSWPYPRLSSVR